MLLIAMFATVMLDSLHGLACETDIDECEVDLCWNGGSCQDMPNRFHCDCPSGYQGIYCNENINECSSSPCNSGVCLDGENSYVCKCQHGYTGIQCETDVDDCNNISCLNDGTCRDGVNSYECICSAGFAGRHCEFGISECFSSPCTLLCGHG